MSREFELRVAADELRHLRPDEDTVALWDWQGPSSRYIPDLMGDAELTLTWVNTKGDTRLPRPGWGNYPHFIGGGEGGFVGPQWNDKVDLRTIESEWTVEAWVRRGGPIDGYFREFHFGHICGTYDNTDRGVWELYLSDQDSPDGKLIWKMKSPDGRKLFNNRRHLAQLIGLLTEGLVRETGLEPTTYR